MIATLWFFPASRPSGILPDRAYEMLEAGFGRSPNEDMIKGVLRSGARVYRAHVDGVAFNRWPFLEEGLMLLDAGLLSVTRQGRSVRLAMLRDEEWSDVVVKAESEPPRLEREPDIMSVCPAAMVGLAREVISAQSAGGKDAFFERPSSTFPA